MNSDLLRLMENLHIRCDRQGPGSPQTSLQALALAGLSPETGSDVPESSLAVADIGCGSGTGTLFLAEKLNARITAVDFLPGFLTRLDERARQAGVRDNITPLEASMEELPFENEQFDLIWSEGAVYNIGFRTALRDWKRFLKPGGHLLVTEITWLSDERPPELEEFWNSAYAEMGTATEKLQIAESLGYRVNGYFPLPPDCWLENYYLPLENIFEDFLLEHRNDPIAADLIREEQEEIALYRKYQEYYSYGSYILQI